MTRTRIALSVTTVGLAAALGLSGCGVAQTPAADVTDEAIALQQVGFDTGLAADPAPSASTDAKTPADRRQERRQNVRKFLRKNTLHGEITVQGKDGVKTVVVQRGTVTAVDGKTVSVKSTDGFTLTWTEGDKLVVRQDKKKADASAIKTGAEIGLAGQKDGAAATARLIVIK